MATKPSQRTHRMRPIEGLNLVPMIDIITNLMFFLMMFASLVPVVMIDAPLPKVAASAEEVRMAKNNENKLEVTLSITSKGFVVRTDFAPERAIGLAADGKYNFQELHNQLVQLHQKRPNIKEITLLPADDVPYEVMIQVMDTTRELAKGDPGYQSIPPEIAQKPESIQFNRLFPDVNLGGV